MVETDALFRIAHAAEEAGDHDFARHSFERGAALGDASCVMRLAYMYDVGGLGVEVDKVRAMQLYRRAWRQGCPGCATNIAILYRERGNHRAMFQWFKREADAGDGDAQLDLAKCFLNGTGVRKCAQSALRCLSAAISSEYVTEASREEAQDILEKLRPRVI